ncbi:Sensors of blue-light using FAD [Hartmannibacter diazotrophicus]|uniref:Sensors of blue-light using FAD n=1 Tax=Hartmannibacter diazotrophicus TaxID=1482074 RepID=A0A2C9D3U3_9HYPH|nr:BLUF domain-containing protein [Hartmannibacter diazotrophicus]SON54471.1 Sensors of blue-light using FAD [Hartmannibacter diazotrophicus]
MYLTRFTFYSENAVKNSNISSADHIKNILVTCSRNTLASGLSGALIFNDRHFVQVMEGERSMLTRSVLNIIKDERSRDVVLVKAAPISVRRFPGWTVGYAGHTEKLDAIYLKHGVTAGLDPTRMSATSIEDLIADMMTVKSPFILRNKGGSPHPAPPQPASTEPQEVIHIKANVPPPKQPTLASVVGWGS